VGLAITSFVLYCWFAKVISENAQGMNNAMLNRSYVWGMGWFIFSGSDVLRGLFWRASSTFGRLLCRGWAAKAQRV
jgi:hypothetical protein